MEPSVQQQRFTAAITERIAEAIGTLNDEELSGLTVLEVKVARGKSDAVVYIDGSDIPKKEWPRYLNKLQKASGYVSRYCLAAESWYKMPKLTFKFDETMEQSKRLEALFAQIKKDRDGSAD